jgi:hypothetical protein
LCLFPPEPRPVSINIWAFLWGLIGGILAIGLSTGSWQNLLIGMLLIVAILLAWWAEKWLTARHRPRRRDVAAIVDQAKELLASQRDGLKRANDLLKNIKRHDRELRKEEHFEIGPRR